VLTAEHRNSLLRYEVFHKPLTETDPLERRKEWKLDMRFGKGKVMSGHGYGL
jgi:hypothetical protein